MMALVSLLCAYAQRKFPYHIEGVISNDELYGGTVEYMNDLDEHLESLMKDILKNLATIGEDKSDYSQRAQGELALELCNLMVANFKMNEHVTKVCSGLFKLALQGK